MKLLVTSKQKQTIKHLNTNYIQKPRETHHHHHHHQEISKSIMKWNKTTTSNKPTRPLEKIHQKPYQRLPTEPQVPPQTNIKHPFWPPPHKMKASTAMPINMQNRERGEQKGKQTCIRGLLATRAGTIITRIPTSDVTGRKTIVTLE